MAYIHFYYNQRDDIKNWLRQAQKEELGLLDNSTKNKFNRAAYNIEKEKILKSWLQGKNYTKVAKQSAAALNKEWPKYETPIFRLLETMSNKTYTKNNYNCAITTHYLCPYDVKNSWFMVSTHTPLPQQITNVAHELLHLYISRHFHKYKKTLGERKWQIFLESITALLNTAPWQKILPASDKGHKEHKAYRAKILELWQQYKDFNKSINKFAQHLKNE